MIYDLSRLSWHRTAKLKYLNSYGSQASCNSLFTLQAETIFPLDTYLGPPDEFKSNIHCSFSCVLISTNSWDKYLPLSSAAAFSLFAAGRYCTVGLMTEVYSECLMRPKPWAERGLKMSRAAVCDISLHVFITVNPLTACYVIFGGKILIRSAFESFYHWVIPARGHAALFLVLLSAASECDQLSTTAAPSSVKVNHPQSLLCLPSSSYSGAPSVRAQRLSVERTDL